MAGEPHIEDHESFIKTPLQLAVVVFLAFAVPIAIIALLSQYVTSHIKIDSVAVADQSAEAVAARTRSADATAKRIQPVGEVVMAGAETPAAAAPAAPAAAAPAAAAMDGKTVYEKACTVCHGAGIAGAPKAGDKGAWGPRIAQGKDTLYKHALEGFKTMPAKGGNGALSDGEVKAAVDVMVGMAK